MNFFLVLIAVAAGGGAYYMYTQNQDDEQKIADLQHQVDDLTAKAKVAATNNGSVVNPSASPRVTNAIIAPSAGIAPDASHSSAIDAAATAAAAASNSTGIGTFTTLDGHTYTNCKVLKVEQDGVTFSHDDGITKILYPLMPPNVQKMFNYDPQKAVAETEAKIRYDEQQSAASNSAPAPVNP